MMHRQRVTAAAAVTIIFRFKLKEAWQYSNAIHKETGSANQRQSLRLPNNKAPKVWCSSGSCRIRKRCSIPPAEVVETWGTCNKNLVGLLIYIYSPSLIYILYVLDTRIYNHVLHLHCQFIKKKKEICCADGRQQFTCNASNMKTKTLSLTSHRSSANDYTPKKTFVLFICHGGFGKFRKLIAIKFSIILF